MLRKYSFFTVARRDSAASPIKAVEFLGLGININPVTLSSDQQTQLNTGFRKFLKNEELLKEGPIQHLIQCELESKDQEGEEIQPISWEEANQKLELHDQLESISIEFKSARRANRCERFLPPIMKITFGAEMLLFIPLLSTAVGMSEMELFSATPSLAKGFGATQGALFILYNLVSTFVSPGGSHMGSIGRIFDNFFYGCWKAITCMETQAANAKKKIDDCCNRTKRWLAKGGMVLFAFSFLFSDFLMNYQQFRSMSMQVMLMAPYTIFPEDMLLFAMKTNFYLNQFNDPIYAASLVKYMFDRIDKRWPTRLVSEEKVEAKEAEQKHVVSQIGVFAPPTSTSAVTAPLIHPATQQSDQERQQRRACCVIL